MYRTRIIRKRSSRWRPLRRLATTTVQASTFAVALTGLPCAAPAADGAPGDTERAHRGSPGLVVGGGVGYANHFGRTHEVDAVTGASTPVEKFSKSGIAVNAFADLAALDVGRGNLGITTGFTLATPTTFMNFSVQPRYRYRFLLGNPVIRTLEPWVGLGVALAFREKLDGNYYLWLPLSAGCDFGLGFDDLYGGIAVDVNTINPKGVTRDPAHDQRMDNLVVLMRLSYRVL